MKRRHFVAGTGLAAAASATVLPARAQASGLRIGLLTTLSGPSAGLGRDTVDGFNLGIKHAGGRLGGLATEVISADDQLKPDVGKATAERMVQTRQRSPFDSLERARVLLGPDFPIEQRGVAVASAFFEVSGRLRLEERVVEEHSLVERVGDQFVTHHRERVNAHTGVP